MKGKQLMKNSRIPAFLFAIVVSLAVSIPAQAVLCVKRTTTYWGYNYSDGSSSCYVVIGPQPPLEVVGERIRECDGTTWSWGLTSCPDFTVETEDCPPCYQQQTTDSESQNRIGAVANACQAEEGPKKQPNQ